MDATQARKMCEECLNNLYIRRDVDRMKEFYSDNVVAHPAVPGVPPGLPGLQLMSQAWLAAFSDMGFTLENFTHDQGNVTMRFVVTAKHTGTFMGIAPTGRSITIVDDTRYRLENGKIAELWNAMDVSGLIKQLS